MQTHNFKDYSEHKLICLLNYEIILLYKIKIEALKRYKLKKLQDTISISAYLSDRIENKFFHEQVTKIDTITKYLYNLQQDKIRQYEDPLFQYYTTQQKHTSKTEV